jgi:hypothetical protein
MAKAEQKPLPAEIELARDVLDKQMVDCDHEPLGRADSIVLVVDGSAPPRVARLECGAPSLARRIGRHPGKWVAALGRRFGVHGGKPVRVAFSKIRSGGIELQIDTHADRSPMLAWERWVGQHITRYIPGRKDR